MVNRSQDIDELAKNIPKVELISIVKEHFPKFTSKKKFDYLKKLKEISLEKYREFAVYYSATRETNIYLYIKEGKIETVDGTSALQLFKPKKFTDLEGIVYEINNSGHMPDSQTVFFTLNIHSPIKKFKEEKADMSGHYDIDYRRQRTIIVFFHYNFNCFEFRTTSKSKTDLAVKFISKEVFGNVEALRLKFISPEQQKLLCGGSAEYKEAEVVFNRPFHGTTKMMLEGDNVEDLLAFLPLRGIGLDNATILKRKITSSNQLFSFYDNGRISIKKQIPNPFTVIAKVIFPNVKT